MKKIIPFALAVLMQGCAIASPLPTNAPASITAAYSQPPTNAESVEIWSLPITATDYLQGTNSINWSLLTSNMPPQRVNVFYTVPATDAMIMACSVSTNGNRFWYPTMVPFSSHETVPAPSFLK